MSIPLLDVELIACQSCSCQLCDTTYGLHSLHDLYGGKTCKEVQEPKAYKLHLLTALEPKLQAKLGLLALQLASRTAHHLHQLMRQVQARSAFNTLSCQLCTMFHHHVTLHTYRVAFFLYALD